MSVAPPQLAEVRPVFGPAPVQPAPEPFIPKPLSPKPRRRSCFWLLFFTAMYAVAAPAALFWGWVKTATWIPPRNPGTLADLEMVQAISDYLWSYPWLVTKVYFFFLIICLVCWISNRQSPEI